MRPTIRSTLILPGLLALALATAACSSSAASPTASPAASPTPKLGATCEQLGTTPNVQQTTHLAVGAKTTIDLCSNATTGYAWEPPTVAEPAVVTVVSSVYVAPGDASPPVVGAAGRQVVTIKGLAPGTTTVAMKYSQPWAGGQSAWTYQLEVTVP